MEKALIVTPNSHELILHRLIEENTDFESFEKNLVLFVKALRYWKGWIREENDNLSNDSNSIENSQFDLLNSGVIKI